MRGIASLLLVVAAAGCAGTLPRADRDLFTAIKRGDAGEVERLLASGANANVKPVRDYDGLPPLGWASGWGSTKIVELLLARGANVNGANEHATTPLHVAAYREDPAVAAVLVHKGAAVSARNELGFTPLHKAMERLALAPATRAAPADEVAKVSSLVELLLASGAQIDAQTASGAMPIHLAALSGQKSLVQVLLDKGAAVDARSTEGMTPLYQAARKDAAEVAQLLIARGADVNARTRSGFTPLTMAAEQGSDEVARLLVAGRADVNARDAKRFTPLLAACRSLLIRYTLEASTPGAADIRSKFPAGEVAKTRAALGEVRGNFGAVALLLVNSGADPNVPTPAFTPLGAAATVGDLALADALIAHGAAMNDTSTGESALHAAIAEGHPDVVKLLIARGANVNARNMSQLTPLHFVARYTRDRSLAELLIQHGADVNAKERDGHTPIEVAVGARNDEIAAVLRQHGAR
ncbi:MAG TPA: ankyrin repeat domain-containing protein [Polyangia bacterium]